jgi:Dolichyl-phosphate-mannose-protein mannosyltransferase
MAKKHRSRRTAAPAAELPAAAGNRMVPVLRQYSLAGFFVLVLIATGRIVLTYPVFNHTIDEPAHIACGMEWLDKGTYNLEDQHPPLARVAAALGPYVDGARSHGRPGIYYEGAAILYGQNHYDRTLTLARLGILPFFWMACVVVYWWTRRSFGPECALIAILLFTMLPAVLANAGLATTDMALTATLGAAFFAMLVWAERPTMAMSVLFGLAGALAILSKFSSLPFFAAAALVLLIWHLWADRPGAGAFWRTLRARIPPAAVAAAVGFLVIWAGYRFAFGEVHSLGISLPAPHLYSGIHAVIEHNAKGHPSYLLGQFSESGFWYYYPVALAVKTPLGFLALALAGLWIAWRSRKANGAMRELRGPTSLIAGVLLAGLVSRINIGIRHVLPVYVAGSILAAYVCHRVLLRERGPRWLLAGTGALIAWLAVSSAISHPDYLAYFNELVPSRPERVLVDSDLDWGQDMKRLARRLHEVGARSVAFDPFIIAYLERVHGFPPIHASNPLYPSPGWNAVSVTVLKLSRLGLDRSITSVEPWPERVPEQERAGKSILLYYFANPTQPGTPGQ